MTLTGIIGGKFMERDRVKKPEQALYKAQLSQYYQAVDLYVGATLNLHGHKFVLMDADEYAFRHMEEHGDEVASRDLFLTAVFGCALSVSICVLCRAVYCIDLYAV